MSDRPPGPIYVPNPTPSSSSNMDNSSLPPPRFQPGSTGGIRESMQKDPLLKLIPSKRPQVPDPALLPPLPSNSSDIPPSKRPRQRVYSVGALPVTQKWEDELDLWANQEIEILAQTDRDLAEQELSIVFGSAGKQAMQGIRNTLRTSSNPRQFLYCKKTIAAMLNRHRIDAKPNAPLIPVDIDHASLPEAAKRFSTPSTSTSSVPPVPSTAPTTAFASPEPRDIKPEVITLSDDDEIPPPPPPPTTVPSQPPLVDPPPGKLYQVPGMSKPFPRYLVEVYLSTRQRFNDVEASFRMIKTVFPSWVQNCGEPQANAYIATLEKMAADEDQQGGPTPDEKQRRVDCLTYLASTGKVSSSSRQNSPENVRNRTAARNSHPQSTTTTQPTIRPRQSPSPPPPPRDRYKTCNKCVNEAVTCDGSDPCGQCVSRGRFHLCTFPDPPPVNERDESLAQSLSVLRGRRQSGNSTTPSQASTSMARQPSSSSSTARHASSGGGGGAANHSPTIPVAQRHPPSLSSSFGASSNQSRPTPSRNISFPPPGRQSVSLDQAREIARNASNRSRQNSGASNPPVAIPAHSPSTATPTSRGLPSGPLGSPASPPQQRRDSAGTKWSHYEGPSSSKSSNRPSSLDARTQQAVFSQPQPSSRPPPNPSTSSSSTPHVPQQQQNPTPQPNRRSNPNPTPRRRQLYQSPAWQRFLQGLPPHLHTLQQCAVPFQPGTPFGSQSLSRPGSSHSL